MLYFKKTYREIHRTEKQLCSQSSSVLVNQEIYSCKRQQIESSYNELGLGHRLVVIEEHVLVYYCNKGAQTHEDKATAWFSPSGKESQISNPPAI